MSGKQYKHLFFDLDHTLWDFDRNSYAAMRQLFDEYRLAERGIADYDAFYKTFSAHNDRLWERFRNGYMRRDDLRWKRIWYTLLDYKVADTNLAYELSAAFIEVLPAQKLLVPKAKELLDHCQGRYKMHLITNGFETTQSRKLHGSGIGGYFSEMITSERSSCLKPHAGIYAYALECTGATAAESIMIGDALEIDIMGALNAGWDQIYYNPAGIPHQRRPTHEVRCLGEIMDIL